MPSPAFSRAATSALILAIGVGVAAPTPAVAAEVHARTASGVFEVVGHGWGHGHGMSQWGAQGAASRGAPFRTILAAYYPGTRLASLPASSRIRVWLGQDGDGDLRVAPTRGLSVYSADGSVALPASVGARPVTGWRIRLSGATRVLEYATDGWHRMAVRGHPTLSGTAGFRAAGGVLRLRYPDGTARDYRGELQALLAGGRLTVLDVVPLEDYLRSVVSLEMDPDWRAEALKAQAVAARTYAAWKRAHAGAKAYDICDSTSCQAYPGVRAYDRSGRLVRTYEAATTDTATRATAGSVLTFRGGYAFTEFSDSNGGYSTAGDQPYLRAAADPWDGIVPNRSHTWTGRYTARQVEAVWPAVGVLARVVVLARDGKGEWGGRIVSMRLEGSRGSVTVPGTAFARAVGLKSRWWRAGRAPSR